MIRVDVPEHGTFVDFPDGTPPAEIEQVMAQNFPPVDSRAKFIEQESANSEADKRMFKAGANRMFGMDASAQDARSISTPKSAQAAQGARTFVTNDVPAVAKTFGAKIGGGMEQSIGGLMRAEGERQGEMYPSFPTSLEEEAANNAAVDAWRQNLVQRGMNLGNEGRAVIQAAQEDQPTQTRAGKILDQTVQSIGSNLPGMAATMVTGSPAVGLSMMGGQTFGQTYDESRARGLSIADATQNAAIQGGAEVATEMLPFVALSKYLKTGNLSKEVLKHYLSDIPGEHLATAIQNASDAAYNTADMTPQQRLDAAADYLTSHQHKEDQIDTFFTTLLQGATMAGMAKTARLGASTVTPAPQPAPSGPLSRAVSRAAAPVQGIGALVSERRGMAGPAMQAAAPVAEAQPTEPPAPAAQPVTLTQEPFVPRGAAPVAAISDMVGASRDRVATIPANDGIAPADGVAPTAQPIAAPITGGIINETANEVGQDERQYADGQEANADGAAAQGDAAAGVQAVQRPADAEGKGGVAAKVPESQQNTAAQIPPVAGLSEGGDSQVSPEKRAETPITPAPQKDTATPLTDEVEAEALQAMREGRVYLDRSGKNYMLSDEAGDGWKSPTSLKKAPWDKAIRTKYPNYRDLYQAAKGTPSPIAPEQPKQETPHEAPPAEVVPPTQQTAAADEGPSRGILQTLAKPKKKSDASIANLAAQHGRDAVNAMVTSGYIAFPGRGMAELTKKGRAWLETNPAPLSPLEATQLANLAKNKKRSEKQEAKYQELSARQGDVASSPAKGQSGKLAEVKGYKYKTSNLKHLIEDKDGFDPATDDFHAELLKYAYPPAKAYNDIMEAHKGNPSGVEFKSKDSDRYAFVTPEMSGKGKYRVQYFDSNGFSSHAEHPSLEEAVEEMVKDGFRIESRGALDKISATDSFQNGNAVSALIGKVNSGEMSWDDFIKRREEIYTPKTEKTVASEKEWIPNVGDTVYFEDAFDSNKRHPANFRGFNGDNAVVVWNGSQMSLDKKRIFNAPAAVEPDFATILSNLEKQTAVDKGKSGKGNWSVSDFQEYLKQFYPSVAGMDKSRVMGALNAQIKGRALTEGHQQVIEAFRHDEQELVAKYGPLDDHAEAIAEMVADEDSASAMDFFDAIIAENEREMPHAQSADQGEDQGVSGEVPAQGAERDTPQSQGQTLRYEKLATGEDQSKLFSTPPAFGKKPQKGGSASTGDLVDNFTPDPQQSLYSTADSAPEPLTLARVQSSFPTLPITEKDGVFTITTPSGVPIRISKVGEIEFDRKAAEEAYGREIGPHEAPVAEFRPLDHGAVINLTDKGVGELDHETFHAAMALALNAKQRAAVISKFGNEEKAAAEYQRLKDTGAFEEKKGHLFLNAIYRFFRNLRQLIAPTAHGVMQDVASGRVWGKAHAADGGTKYAAAWHGSPHDHNKFTTAKIGTGEGAQAYGWGLYFAGSKDVAEWYRGKLSSELKYKGRKMNRESGRNTVDAAAWAVFLSEGDKEAAKRSGLAAPEKIDAIDPSGLKAGGKLYHVELAPQEDDYLDWDKPLSEQSDKVKDALGDRVYEKEYFIDGIPLHEVSLAPIVRAKLRTALKESGGDFNKALSTFKGYSDTASWQTKADELAAKYSGAKVTIGQTATKPGNHGERLYKNLSQELGGDQAASEYLHSLGIRGIKYLDGTSRGKGEGNHNFVIFDESDVEIKAKYSLKSAFDRHSPTELKAALTLHPKVQSLVAAAFDNGRNVTGWQKTVGTMYHLAEKLAAKGKPQFKEVFNKGQEFLNDISAFAVAAESLAPDIFPKLGTGKGIFHNLPRKDAVAIAEPLYQGTLFGGADPTHGKVFSDTELRRIFKLTDQQIDIYRQARAATDQSLDDMARSLIAKNAKQAKVDYDREMSLVEMAQDVKDSIQSKVDDMQAALDQAEKDFEEASKTLEGKELKDAQKQHLKFTHPQEAAIDLYKSLIQNIDNLSHKTETLKKRGYFPLMRFGEYTVTMKDRNGETQFFGMYESAYKAKLIESALREQHPNNTVVQSVMSKESFKLYGGMNLEALQLFAEHLGADETAAYQEYLKVGMANRSAMKRLIHRKGTAGYSEDAVRTLANFIVSNARHASTQYNLHDMRKLAAEIPEDTQGDVKDQAVKLFEYLTKPVEEAAKLRGYLFFHYLGGSLSAGIVNMTQPVMMTAPYLATKANPAKVAKHLAKASKMAFTDPAKIAGSLGTALRRAEKDGVTAPQEIHQLTAIASNKLLASNTVVNAAMKAWGGFFSVAEAFNRRVTFIASYRISRENGMSDHAAYQEAINAVTATQGVYNRGNRPNWGRGIIGAPLYTFKQFGVMYLELFNRLPAKQKALMMGILWLMAGLQGLPFAEDAEDIIDTIGQWGGYATNSKHWLDRTAKDALGDKAGSFLTGGVSSVLPIDIQGRMGMHNLIPGTGFLKQSSTDKGRDIREFFGPMGGLFASLSDALALSATGQPGRAALAASPRAIQNIAQGAEMLATGAGHDKYGRKTMEVSPQEAVAKMTGFNPSRIAEESQIKSANMQDVALFRVRKQEIVNQWAYGIANRDFGEVSAARRKLKDWREKNPDMPMTGVLESARRKAKSMKMTGKERFVKSMPAALRGRLLNEME